MKQAGSNLSRFGRQRFVLAVCQPKAFGGFIQRAHHPIFLYAAAFIFGLLIAFVVMPGGGRKNFNYNVWCAVQPVGLNAVKVFIRDENDVGLINVAAVEVNVIGSNTSFAKTGLFYKLM